MDFDFSETEAIFAESVRRFALDRLAPRSAAWDQGTPFSRQDLHDLAGMGLTGLRIPEEYGGALATYVMCGIASEEIGRGDYGVTLVVQISAMLADALNRYASERVKREYLPAVAAGDCLLSFALTEPGAGSDAAAITASAQREGDHFVINGEKASITFAGFADVCVVFARTGGAGARGVSALLVPLDLPGVTRRVYKSLGDRISQRGSLIFEDVQVLADHLIGNEGDGFIQAMNTFDYTRALIALACLGAARQSLDETIEYARHRRTFGKPLAQHEGVSFQVAEHLTRIEAARFLAYHCLWLRDQGRPHTKEAAMAKWMGPKTAADAIHACIILNGWAGYDQDLPHEQRLRDVIGLEIGDGTPEIMKAIIARETFGREHSALR